MDLIKIEDMKKNYGNTEVLKKISLSVREGEFVGIMGKSGSGKTTLLKILGMIETMSGGDFAYRGKRVEDLTDKETARIRREELGFVFQEFFLMDSLDILENVMLPLFVSKRVNVEGKKRGRALMKRFGIEHLERKMPNELSGGERQRTAICRALINNPQIIYADEPTGNLDSKSGKIVIDSLKKINKEFHKTIVMVTHDPKMASYCDRVILLKDGEILHQLENETNKNDFYKMILESMIEL